MKVSALFAAGTLLVGLLVPVLTAKSPKEDGLKSATDAKPIDYCVLINENFSEGACKDPVKNKDGSSLEVCKEKEEKTVCTRADETVVSGWETLEYEARADQSTREKVCTHFAASDSAGYSTYCSTLETCEIKEGIFGACKFSVEVDGRACKVLVQECEVPDDIVSRAIEVGALAPVVDCPFDRDLKWDGCKEKRSTADGTALHGSFMSVLLADQTPTPPDGSDNNTTATSLTSGSHTTTSWLVSSFQWALVVVLTIFV